LYLKPIQLLFTCEHGGFEIPPEYASIFSGATQWLKSHRGWDKGALDVANTLAHHFEAELVYSQISRLVVDLNRSIGHPRLFSSWTKPLRSEEKQKILEAYYFPYRDRVFQSIKQKIDLGFLVLHISVHSFTPVWKQKRRTTDIGFLYNPHREKEKIFCIEWRKIFHHHFQKLTIHLNRPYRGNTDGFTESLRQSFLEKNYLGIELEINQKRLQSESRQKILQSLIQSLKKCLEDFNLQEK